MASIPYNGPAFDSGDLRDLKQKLVDGCHILDREGITDGYGHVSVRIPGTEAFLTLADVSPGRATLDRLILLDFGGCALSGVVSLTENVVVGVGAAINSTVTIGRNVIITPGAAVMNDLPDDVIVGGVPAKVLGKSRRGG